MAIFTEVPPPHVPSYWVQVHKITYPIGAGLWVVSYILMIRENLRTKSYGMPLFALANNFAWELVYAFYFLDVSAKQIAFAISMMVNVFMVMTNVIMIYSTLRHGGNEWTHAPIVKKNLGKIWLGFTVFCIIGHWTFINWWLGYGVAMKKGKFYLGVEGIDITELIFWSGEFCQTLLSAASLIQLIVRQHTGGVSWAIW